MSRVEHLFSCPRFTVWYATDIDANGTRYICDAAPSIHVFIGQPLDNFRRWVKQRRIFTWHEWEVPESFANFERSGYETT